MTIAQIIFYLFAGLTIVAALFILFAKNVLHAVLSLLVVFVGVAALYVFAGAEFLAVTQLVIYVGGVLVLMLFGVMLTNREIGANYPVSKNKNFLIGLFSGFTLLGVFMYLFIRNKSVFISVSTIQDKNNTLSAIGKSLMSEYVLVFELVGILLLVALIGAAFIAGRKKV